MRVLFLLHAHPDLQAGGTEIFARDLFRTLRSSGVNGLFLAGCAPHQRARSPGTPFQAVGDASDELLVWSAGFDPFYLSQTDLHGLAPKVASLLMEQRPDIVHIHHLMTVGVELVALIRRVLPRTRIVMTLHDYYALCANDGQMVTTSGALCHQAALDACQKCFPDRSLTDFRLRSLHIGGALAQIDHFIAPSHFLRDRFLTTLAEWGIGSDRISVVPNGLPGLTPAPVRSGNAVRRDRFAFFGHINRFKGSTVALDASSRLSANGVVHRLTLHGGTDYQSPDTLSRFATALASAPDAQHRGGYRRADMPRLIADADWVVFPSEWWENAPLVINEAFAHGRPVVCSALGGAAELVQDGRNGLHFPVGDGRALAATMRRAIEENGLWEQLAAGIVPPVSITESSAHHHTLYNSLLASAPARQAA